MKDKKRVNYLLDELGLIIKKLGQLVEQKEERIKELESYKPQATSRKHHNMNTFI